MQDQRLLLEQNLLSNNERQMNKGNQSHRGMSQFAAAFSEWRNLRAAKQLFQKKLKPNWLNGSQL